MKIEKIEHPKVFISYAWGSEEYQNKVLSFADQLVSVGIDVIIDKWDLAEGNDTFAFMERCVNDSTVTNVLMLLDPIYAKKATDHSGGVGTETQIISAKVYQEVEQTKFIPVIMERDVDGSVCKPTYLQGRLHFDLSIPEDYDRTFQHLVKRLFGEEIYTKPPLGSKPAWVEKAVPTPFKSLSAYDSLKISQPLDVKHFAFRKYLSDISDRIVSLAKQNQEYNLSSEEYLNLYGSTEIIRTDYLALLNTVSYVPDSHVEIALFLEDTANRILERRTAGEETAIVFIHELFLYTIAHYLRNKKYSDVGYFLSKTYFNQWNYSSGTRADGYSMFYSGSDYKRLHNAVCSKDNQRYYSGTAKYWLEHIDINFCSKGQLIQADLLCYNYSLYGKDYIPNWAWFPCLYIYESKYDRMFGDFASKMISQERTKEILPLFGYESIEEFTKKFAEVEADNSNQYKNTRYSSCFESAPLLEYYIKSDRIATLK